MLERRVSSIYLQNKKHQLIILWKLSFSAWFSERSWTFLWPKLKQYLFTIQYFSLVLNSFVFRTCSKEELILRPQVWTGLGMWSVWLFCKCYKCYQSVIWHQVGPSGQWWKVENNVKELEFQVCPQSPGTVHLRVSRKVKA